MTASPNETSGQVDHYGIVAEMMTSRVADRRREIFGMMRDSIHTVSDGLPWVAAIQRAVADGQMHECIAEYLIGFYASMVASDLEATDQTSLALELEDERLVHDYWPEGLTEEELEAVKLSDDQRAELHRRGDEIEERRFARHCELEIEVLRAWGGEAMVESIGSNTDEHFERTDVCMAMMFGGEVGIGGGDELPMWFPPGS